MGFTARGTYIDDLGREHQALRRVDYPGSNGYTKYTATLWDGQPVVTSCNCPGWANHRDCWHCKDLRGEPTRQAAKLRQRSRGQSAQQTTIEQTVQRRIVI